MIIVQIRLVPAREFRACEFRAAPQAAPARRASGDRKVCERRRKGTIAHARYQCGWALSRAPLSLWHELPVAPREVAAQGLCSARCCAGSAGLSTFMCGMTAPFFSSVKSLCEVGAQEEGLERRGKAESGQISGRAWKVTPVQHRYEYSACAVPAQHEYSTPSSSSIPVAYQQSSSRVRAEHQ